jgi:hypothetical protein
MLNPLEREARRGRRLGESSGNDLFDAKVLLPLKKQRPLLDDFAGMIDNKGDVVDIIADKSAVIQKKTSPNYVQSRPDASVAAEYMIPYLIEDESVFIPEDDDGLPEVNACMTSEFDDFKRGSDFFLRFGFDDGEEIDMAVDVKTSVEGSRYSEAAQESMSWTMSTYESGHLPSIKYFIDPKTEEKKIDQSCLRLVLVFDREFVIKARDAVSKNNKSRNRDEVRAVNDFRNALLIGMLNESETIIKELKRILAGKLEKVKKDRLQFALGQYIKVVKYFKDLERRLDISRPENAGVAHSRVDASLASTGTRRRVVIDIPKKSAGAGHK